MELRAYGTLNKCTGCRVGARGDVVVERGTVKGQEHGCMDLF